MSNPIEEIMYKIIHDYYMEPYEKEETKQSKHKCKCGGSCVEKDIVHCKDCAYYNSEQKSCKILEVTCTEEDFCSRGKKPENIETITKEEYETLSMLKAFGTETLVYETLSFVCEECVYAYGKNFNAEILGENVQMLKHLFKKQSERCIDDLMKLEVID